ncbi:cytoskeleton protein RodZ [Vibrio nereis]|uniref:Transcriptional regulator n=1 Tax=Vibrio nereis TaxID=693 RepID=A0A0M0HPG9_VIBNE|nr:cytoskeleton protein RodZ [Vibrio nereis]KOO04000.1 transcriptional regulator [Vibrio nereis]
MTAENETTATEENHTAVKAGTLLKHKREQLGLSQKQVADRLRLRVTIIEDIESNQFASDQSATFTKGYLRSYAKAVGMDINEVLRAYASEHKPEPEEHEMKSFSGKAKREKHDSRIMILTWGIVAVILGISSVWWWQNQQTSMVDLTETTEQEQEIEQELGNAEQQDPMLYLEETASQAEHKFTTLDDTPAQATDTVDEQSDNTLAEGDTENAILESAPVEVEESTVPEVAANLLNLQFNGDCWVQVKDNSGNTLSSGVKKAGEKLELTGAMPYKVVLGAPENVSMTLSSEPVDLSGYTSGKVARFTLP